VIVTRSPALIRRERPGLIRSVGESRFGRVLDRPRRVSLGDPFWNKVVLLAHMDGDDGSTTFVDKKKHALTANGNAQIDTAQFKFGGAAALFDGTGDFITTPDSADWHFGNKDFTIEFWLRFNSTINQLAWLVGQMEGNANRWGLYWNWNNTLTEGTGPTFIARENSVTLVNFSQGALTGWAIDTWYHVACVRKGDDFRIYRDGDAVASATDGDAMPDLAPPLYIGGEDSNVYVVNGTYLNGWIDEMRITKGVARYGGDFTPPAAAFPDA
jgi:hypothetical protein